MNLEKHIKNYSPEFQEKARKCGSVNELFRLAKDERVPLPMSALEEVSAGMCGCGPKDPDWHCPCCSGDSVCAACPCREGVICAGCPCRQEGTSAGCSMKLSSRKECPYHP